MLAANKSTCVWPTTRRSIRILMTMMQENSMFYISSLVGLKCLHLECFSNIPSKPMSMDSS